MKLELLRGPLGPRWTEAIARLYGRFNRKYADVEHCRKLFDRAPHGASLHAFAVDDAGTAVGHYGLVPMAIRVHGERRRSAKGEAYVVDPACREAEVVYENDPPMGIGLALPVHLYELAMAEGIDVVHMLAPPEVAPLHRMAGCRSVAVEHVRSGVILRPEHTADLAGGPWASAGRRWLLHVQSAGSALVALTRVGGRVARAAPPTREQLARIVGDRPATAGWGLDVDTAMLEWLASFADLQLLLLDDAMDDYALITTRGGEGRGTEVLCWHQRRPGRPAAECLLASVLAHARRVGSDWVAVSDRSAAGTETRGFLRDAARAMLLRGRSRQPGFLVFSKDRSFAEPGALAFDPFFYAAF